MVKRTQTIRRKQLKRLRLSDILDLLIICAGTEDSGKYLMYVLYAWKVVLSPQAAFFSNESTAVPVFLKRLLFKAKNYI